ncbi:Na+/H+ antiporter NhaA [Microbacterium sp. STN6]|uniref:Na+/H+ antiporter NhaA n=1 Tax=Microbacterium sp. STN6 TaxID=2995588 RepID=UPI002260A05B|nr:Na+/H+ antiporter NhaA [Microbacterium sp. STN6]MCX7521831.1 Na+/H+ antiporter NhaA [Microbacterium sp. STN6]
MGFIRSERASALILLCAAALGLLLANTGAGPALIELLHSHLSVPGTALDLSVSHWISDGLLAVFFFIVAIELKRELVVGDLNSLGKAALPAIAALGGVAVPALVFLALAGGSGLEKGWPVPTATDIAFALGVLAVFGRSIPQRVRVFLLALAVLDDLVAILIIAFFFTATVHLPALGLAVVTATAFGLLSRLLKPRSAWLLRRRPVWPIVCGMVVLGLATWAFVYLSGIHATIAGVVLGLVLSRRPGGRIATVLEPYSNGIVLPLFALTAAMVAIPHVSVGELSPAFWGIIVALPVGKFVGITLAGSLAVLAVRRRAAAHEGGGSRDPGTGQPGGTALAFADVAVVATLGGIGFTVSLLMNTLAFRGHPTVVDEGTLAVLIGSAVSIVAAAIVVTLRSRHYAQTLRRS